jgi:hypothetical protein
MKLDAVMDEIGDVAATIPDLNVYRWPADEITSPAAMVTYPDSMTFDAAFQRGTDRWRCGLIVAVAKAFDKSTRDQMVRYVAGDGPESIKAAFYAHDWQACAYARPDRVTFDVLTIAGVEYLAALFDLDVAGNGTQEG